jgi:hypothetical protein
MAALREAPPSPAPDVLAACLSAGSGWKSGFVAVTRYLSEQRLDFK